MDKRAIAAASLIATLSLGSSALGASDREPSDNADPAATSKIATGVVSRVGDTYYLTPEFGDAIELSYGPSWLWGAASPLELLAGLEVTLVGQLRDGVPNDDASEAAQEQHADNVPVMHVRSIVGAELREQGRPPWAGGPKVVGEAHPGFQGWSEGQSERTAGKAARSEAKAARAAARAEEKAARAAARAVRADEKGNQP